MTTPVIPRPLVPAPTAAPLEYGLLSVVADSVRMDPHTRYGVEYEPLSGTTGGTATITLPSQARGPMTPETFGVDGDPTFGQLPLVQTAPFLIYAGVQAKPVGHTVEELQARAEAKLALQAGALIEAGLLLGPAGDYSDGLAAAGTTSLSATPVSPARAMGLLHRWMADTVGAKGVIHSPVDAVGALWAQTSIVGGKHVTRLSVPVAYGAGYANVAPGGVAAADGVAWLYATGPLQINRAGVEKMPPSTGASMTLAANLSTVYAAEVVSVGYEAGAVAVPVLID